MKERESSSGNYLIILGKLALSGVFFCLLTNMGPRFWQEASRRGVNLEVIVLSLISVFSFYQFLFDLNPLYSKIQGFFFRSHFVSYIFPSLLLMLGLGYFILPRISGLAVSGDMFTFLGGAAFAIHLIYSSKNERISSLPGFIHYLFSFTGMALVNVFVLGFYLKIKFPLRMGTVLIDSLKSGISLIQEISGRLF